MKRLLLLILLLTACGDRRAQDETGSVDSEVTTRTDVRRSRLARLSKVDALARLYVGRELGRDELLVLGAKSESAVVEALAAHPDFRLRFSARVADFLAADGQGVTSQLALPTAPMIDAFAGRKADADRFARWLVRMLAPLVADDVIAKNQSTLAQMTYKDFLDTIRSRSAAGTVQP